MDEVRLEYLKPAEIEAANAACGAVFLPIGTIEWHGLHNVVGLDALKAYALCVAAAQTGGGLVHPAHYGAVGGLDEPHTFVFDREDSLESTYFQPWIEKWCREAVRNGFKAIILLTGHYGAAQQIAVRSAAVRMTRVLDVPVLGVPEYWLALDAGYYGDHAAFFETSLMMHLFPHTVDLGRLGAAPHQGVGGKDPKTHASADAGRKYADLIVERLAALAVRMPQWTSAEVRSFAEAEQSIVAVQEQYAEPFGSCWKAWERLTDGVMDGYPQALVERRFTEIREMARNL